PRLYYLTILNSPRPLLSREITSFYSVLITANLIIIKFKESKEWMLIHMHNHHLVVEDCKIAVIQDIARYGFEQYGVTINGAMDMYAYMFGNKILQNSINEPSIEIMIFNFSMQTSIEIAICITGAPADVFIDNKQVGMWKEQIIPAGSKLHIKNINRGLRTYIAFKGGLDIPTTLGSASLDLVTKFGESINKGQKLMFKNPSTKNKEDNVLKTLKKPDYGSPWNIRITSGPDFKHFKKRAKLFLNSTYEISSETNHIGIRLNGPPIINDDFQEVLSRGVAIGAVQ